VSLSSTETNFSKALALYTDALIRPSFDANEWERVKRLHLDRLHEALDDPSTVAGRMAMAKYYGPNHPYGRQIDGTLKSVDAITLDDVKSMHDQAYQPGSAVVFAAGSLSADAFKAELELTLGTWKQTRVNIQSDKPKYVEPAKKPLRVYLVEKSGAVQTVVHFILPAPKANTPNRVKLDAIAQLFGGMFTSRLNHNLREEKGYTYGAGAGYAMEPSTGYFVAGSSVRTNVTGASLREFLKEFASIRTGNITAEETHKASQAMRSADVQSAITLRGIIGTAATMYLEGRSYTDLGKELQEIAALTPSQLNTIVKGAIPLENGVLVLVGDKAQILSQLKGLGLPAPTIVVAE
jgi:zinc protease